MGTPVIEIDGSEKSGSGTLVRLAVALCSLTKQPLHMVRIREKREKPGLRPQHLAAVKACAQLSSGQLEGGEAGSREITYRPGEDIQTGDFRLDIGTAGSATMLAFTVIPIALFGKARTHFSITGGLFQDHAPTAFHFEKILLPMLGRMGAKVSMKMIRPGYVPRGNGELEVSIEPLHAPLRAFRSSLIGEIRRIGGISLASNLSSRSVARRMAARSGELLVQKGYNPEIGIIEDSSSVQSGAALLLSAESEGGCLFGFDMAGKRGRTSESIAERAVEGLLADIATGATVDRFAADQLILFAGLAQGQSRYIVPRRTDHIESNLWLIQKILGARTQLKENTITIEGIGFFR